MTVADMTPVAMLLVEHTAITVRADSPVRNLRDLTERLKADAESMVVGTAARGGVNHLALVLAMKAGGVDVKRTPKGTGPAQVAFWEGALARMAAAEEWNKQLAVHEWHSQFLRSKEFIQYLDTQHNANRAIMAEVGLVK